MSDAPSCRADLVEMLLLRPVLPVSASAVGRSETYQPSRRVVAEPAKVRQPATETAEPLALYAFLSLATCHTIFLVEET
jgi:hypothetical protein